MTQTDSLLAKAYTYPDRFVPAADGSAAPRSGVAIVACMDARIDLFAIFGLGVGDAHIIRNAGGLATEDVLRSLAISQRYLGTTEIVLVHHTRCGMLNLDDGNLISELEAETGSRPSWVPGGYTDAAADLRRCVAAIEADPFIPNKDRIRCFVFDVDTGKLEEVETA